MATPDRRTGMTGVDQFSVVGAGIFSQRVGVVLPSCDAALEACSSTEGKLFTAAKHTCGREEACSSTKEKLLAASTNVESTAYFEDDSLAFASAGPPLSSSREKG